MKFDILASVKSKYILVFTYLLISSISLSMDNREKEAFVKEIYDRLVDASDFKSNAPKIEFSRSKTHVAKISQNVESKQKSIIVEYAAIDVCLSFEERAQDAMAFILAHELSHIDHFDAKLVYSYSLGNNLEIYMEKIGIQQLKQNETVADFKGGILSYVAGFNTKGVGEKLLKKLYASNYLKENKNYPSLEERVKIARQQDDKVQKYIKIFEASNMYMLIGDYQKASSLYSYLLDNDINCREIYNNLGVAYFNMAVKSANPSFIKYVYPIEMDLESILGVSGKRNNENIIYYLNESLKKFEQATDFDEDFISGYINMACVQTILKENKKGGSYFNEARRNCEKAKEKLEDSSNKATNQLNNIDMLLAIIQIEKGENVTAGKKILRKLAQKNHLYSEINYLLVKENMTINNYKSIDKSFFQNEVSAFKNLNAYSGDPETLSDYHDTDYKINVLKKMESLNQYEIEIDRGNIFITECDSSHYYFIKCNSEKLDLFHNSKSNDMKTSVGLRIGDGLDSFLLTYGAPSDVMLSAQGNLYIFKKANLIILVNNDRVVEMICYRNDFIQ